jgi:hypothetical protein
MQLPFAHGRESLQKYFSAALKRTVALTLTDNITSMMSYRNGKDNTISLRLHRMFINASDEVLGELTRYLKTGKGRTPLMWAFVQEHKHLLKNRPQREIKLRSQGTRYELSEIFQCINKEYFNDAIKCGITWGMVPKKKRVRCRTLGSYSAATNTIRISPVLDKKNIPAYYVEFVVYHEMLHAALHKERTDGKKWSSHTGEFRSREKMFKEYSKVLKWEKR